MTVEQVLENIKTLSSEEQHLIHQHLSEILGRNTDWRSLVLAIEGLREGLSDAQLDKIEAAVTGLPSSDQKA
jgi:hypothetical protein